MPAEHLGDLGVRRIPQHLVAEDHRGQMASVAQLVQHPPALVGIVGQELAGDGVARGQIKEILTARRPALAHDANHRLLRQRSPRPAAEDFADHGIESLLRTTPGLLQVRVELTEDERPADGLVCSVVSKVNQCAAASSRAKLAHADEPFRTTGPGRPQIRHHQRHLLAAFAGLLDAGESGRWRDIGEDPVIHTESPLEHGRERLQRGGVAIDYEQDRLSHENPPPARHHPTLQTCARERSEALPSGYQAFDPRRSPPAHARRDL